MRNYRISAQVAPNQLSDTFHAELYKTAVATIPNE